MNVSYLIIAFSLLGQASRGWAEYSKVSNAGYTLPMSTALGAGPEEWACTYEDKTRLIWEIKTQEGGGLFVDQSKIGFRDKTWSYSWFMSDSALNGGFAGLANGGNCFDGKDCDIESYVRQVNAQGLCGAHDWRLPTDKELATLRLSYSSVNSADPWQLNDYSSGGSYAQSGFWSSTTTPFPEKAWYFRTSNGESGQKSDPHRVMLVRGAPEFKPLDFKESQYKEEIWDFKTPGNLALAPDESLFVADSFNHRIVQLSQNGVRLNTFGDFSHTLDSPGLLAFAADGTLLVDDPGNNRIQRFKTDGTLISTVSKPKQAPVLDMDLTTDGGLILLLDSNHVQRLNADGSVKWLFELPREENPIPPITSVTNAIHRLSATPDDSVCLQTSKTITMPIYHVPTTWYPMRLEADGTSNGKYCDSTPSHRRYIISQAGISRDVITKAGIKFVAEPYYNRIRKFTPNVPEYTYVASTGMAIFENIMIGDAHYWVQLQEQANLQFKVVKAYLIKPEVDYKTSVYDPETGLVILPKVTADGINYQVVMQRLDNGLFGVQSAEPLPKQANY